MLPRGDSVRISLVNSAISLFNTVCKVRGKIPTPFNLRRINCAKRMLLTHSPLVIQCMMCSVVRPTIEHAMYRPSVVPYAKAKLTYPCLRIGYSRICWGNGWINNSVNMVYFSVVYKCAGVQASSTSVTRTIPILPMFHLMRDSHVETRSHHPQFRLRKVVGHFHVQA